MNKTEFSEAMNGINDRFIDEAINYKPEKKIIYPFFRKAAVCAAVLAIVTGISAFFVFSGQKPQVSLGSSVIAEEELPVECAERGISLISEGLSVRLSLKRVKSATVSVSGGIISVFENGNIVGESSTLRLDGNSEIIWFIDSPDTESVYKLKIEKKTAETELTLKYEKERNLWVISKS